MRVYRSFVTACLTYIASNTCAMLTFARDLRIAASLYKRLKVFINRFFIIPMQTGIQCLGRFWIPAFAGMTALKCNHETFSAAC